MSPAATTYVKTTRPVGVTPIGWSSGKRRTRGEAPQPTVLCWSRSQGSDAAIIPKNATFSSSVPSHMRSGDKTTLSSRISRSMAWRAGTGRR